MRESIKISAEAAKLISEKKLEGADEALRKASGLWGNNDVVKQLQPELAALRAIASAAPPQAETAPAPEKAPAPDESAAEKSASASLEDEPEYVEPEKPFFQTPGGIITALVVIGVLIAGATAYKKIRGKASDVLE